MRNVLEAEGDAVCVVLKETAARVQEVTSCFSVVGVDRQTRTIENNCESGDAIHEILWDYASNEAVCVS